MKVFAPYEKDRASLIRIWSESWRRAGWVPQLLSQKEILGAGSAYKAAERRGGGAVTELGVINFSLRVCKYTRFKSAEFPKEGWKESRLALFPVGTTEEDIRGCGRALM